MQGFVARMVEGVKQNTFSRLLVNIVQVMVIAFNTSIRIQLVEKTMIIFVNK